MFTHDEDMNPAQKSNLPTVIASILGGVCFAVSITLLITNKPDYPFIAQIIFFTGWLLLWCPVIYLLFKKWVTPRLAGMSRWTLVLHVVLSFFASAIIVFATPVNDQLRSLRKVSLEIIATAEKNPLATGNEIGILAASRDGVGIPWSEFSWEENWGEVGGRPYFHNADPARITWQGYTRNERLTLSLLLYSHSSSGILEVKLNSVKRTIDLYENSNGSIKHVDFLFSQKDWRWVVLSAAFTLAIGVLIFIGTRIPFSSFVIPITIGAIIVNVTVFQKINPLPPLRSLSTNEIDLVGVTDHLWDPSGVMAVYLYPSLRGTTLMSTPELILAFSEMRPFEKSERISLDWLVPVCNWMKRTLALKDCKSSQYDYLLSRDEIEILEKEQLLKWDLSSGGKLIVLSGAEKKVYVMMKYNHGPTYYYFVPIEIATRGLNRNFK